MIDSLILLGSGLISGVLLVFLLNAALNFSTRKLIKPNDSPLGLHVLKAAAFISAGLLVDELLHALRALQHTLPAVSNIEAYLVEGLSYYGLFLGTVIVVVLVLVYLSALMFSLVSGGKNVFVESANESYSSMLLYASVLLAFTFAVKASLGAFMETFIPYQEPVIY